MLFFKMGIINFLLEQTNLLPALQIFKTQNDSIWSWETSGTPLHLNSLYLQQNCKSWTSMNIPYRPKASGNSKLKPVKYETTYVPCSVLDKRLLLHKSDEKQMLENFQTLVSYIIYGLFRNQY